MLNDIAPVTKNDIAPVTKSVPPDATGRRPPREPPRDRQPDRRDRPGQGTTASDQEPTDQERHVGTKVDVRG